MAILSYSLPDAVSNALSPIAIFLSPVVRAVRVLVPIPIFFKAAPDVLFRAFSPKAILSSASV